MKHHKEDLSLIGKTIIITNFQGNGTIFDNIIKDSEHTIINSPDGLFGKYLEGVWVMGNGQPIKILSNEYILKK